MRRLVLTSMLAAGLGVASATAQQGSGALRAYRPAIDLSFAPQPTDAATAARMVVVAARPLPARHVLGPDDVRLEARRSVAGLPDPGLAIGRETDTPVSAGQVLRAEALSAPAVIDRNDRVVLRYRRGALTIRVEGRALERASEGKRLAAMNLASRQTVIGTAIGPGLVEVVR